MLNVTLRKFYPLQMYVLDNLVNQRLSCSNPKNFNDPFDCMLLEDKTLYSKFTDKQKEMLQKMHVLCTFEVNKAAKNFNEIQRYFWSFYGDSHKGICIEFELPIKEQNSDVEGIYDFLKTLGDFDESKNLYFSGKAAYEPDFLKNISVIAKSIKLNSFSDVLKNIGFTKDGVFKLENEYRIINLENKKNENYSFFDISNYKKRIIFGNRCNRSICELVKNALGSKYQSYYKVNDSLEEEEYV